jgi:hypothetical protein
MNSTLGVAFGSQITAAAERHHLDPRLLAAVAAQETGGPGADSGRNIVGDGGHGHGVFQIDDRWHAFARTPAAMDPASNADYAAEMISSNIARYGSVRAALSAYNAGSPTATGTTTDWGDGKPVGYADSVLRHLARLTGGEVTATGSAAPLATATASTTAASGGAATEDAGDVNALQALSQQLSSGSVGSAGGGFSLSLPQYQPLPKADDRDRNLAPSAGGDSDDDS